MKSIINLKDLKLDHRGIATLRKTNNRAVLHTPFEDMYFIELYSNVKVYQKLFLDDLRDIEFEYTNFSGDIVTLPESVMLVNRAIFKEYGAGNYHVYAHKLNVLLMTLAHKIGKTLYNHHSTGYVENLLVNISVEDKKVTVKFKELVDIQQYL